MATSTPSDFTTNRKTAWSGKVLIPLWTFQIAGVLLTIGGLLWFLGDYEEYFDLSYSLRENMIVIHHTRVTFAYISAVIMVILCAIALAMIIFQIIRFHKKNLPARTMITTQYILGAWTTICFLIEILGLFSIIQGGYKTIFDFSGVILATATIYGTLIYSNVIRRRRKQAKRESMNLYGMTDYDEEAGPGKDNTRFEVAN